jgi:hypothetical protein
MHSPSSAPAAEQHATVNRLALSATIHCLTGCSIGEVLGMAVGTALHWTNTVTVVASIVLAFFFGYLLTVRTLLRAAIPLTQSVRLALASDTVSITIMELVDTAIMLVWPGAMNAQLSDLLFWISLAVSLVAAGVAAYPVNRWLILRGRGHALVHEQHSMHHAR